MSFRKFVKEKSFFKTPVRSSANRPNLIDFSIVYYNAMDIFVVAYILIHKISKTIINKKAERGSPCLTPVCKCWVEKPLLTTRDVIAKRMDPLYK